MNIEEKMYNAVKESIYATTLIKFNSKLLPSERFKTFKDIEDLYEEYKNNTLENLYLKVLNITTLNKFMNKYIELKNMLNEINIRNNSR